MIKLNLEQGSDQWKKHRSTSRNASEASVMAGKCKQYKRIELIENKALGTEREVSDFVRDIVFAEGHRVEPYARQIAEQLIGDFLDPVVCTDDEGYLSASLDGLSSDGRTSFECKQWNEEKAQLVLDGVIPDADFWQVVQGLHCSGAERCLYVVSDGTEDRTVHLFVPRIQHEIDDLIRMWNIADEDIENYKRDPKLDVSVTPGKAPSYVPQIVLDMNTIVSASNLEEVKTQAIAVFKGINTDLTTDQDFEDAKETAKWCRDIMAGLDEAKKRAIESNNDARAIFDMIDEMRESARQTALTLEKSIKSNNAQIRNDLKQGAMSELLEYIQLLPFGRLIKVGVDVKVDFATAMKNKRSIAGLKEGIEVELASGKNQALAVNDLIYSNDQTLKSISVGYEELFNRDYGQLVKMDPKYMEIDVRSRIDSFEKSLEEKRKAEEQKAIENARAQKEVEQKLKIEKEQREAKAVEVEVEKTPEPSKPEAQPNVGKRDNETSPQTITIPLSVYNQLIKDQFELECINCAGVDNWHGYSYAMEEFLKKYPEG